MDILQLFRSEMSDKNGNKQTFRLAVKNVPDKLDILC